MRRLLLPTSLVSFAACAVACGGDGHQFPAAATSAPAPAPDPDPDPVPAPAGNVPNASLPLVQKVNLVYRGAFRVPPVPGATADTQTFNYAMGPIAYNPARHSLFIAGMAQLDSPIGEIGIPPVINSTNLGDLKTAPLVQAPVDVGGRIPEPGGFNSRAQVYGLMVVDGKLLVGRDEYYDADGSQRTTHFRVEDPNNLAGSALTGMVRVGTAPARATGGYMAEVPAHWQPDLGVTHLTGLAGVPIISTSSFGPAAVGFNAGRLAAATPGTTFTLYRDGELSKTDTPNPYFTPVTAVRGIAFVPGTRSVLFFGTHGGDPGETVCYKTAPAGTCPPEIKTGGYASYKVVNGKPVPAYHHRVWAYDALDFVAVKGGRKQPGQVKPYAYWDFNDVPFATEQKAVGGVAYDPATGTLYVSAPGADAVRPYSSLPVIHAFKVKLP